MTLKLILFLLVLHSKPFPSPLNNIDPTIQEKIPTGINVPGPVCWAHENHKYKYQSLCNKFTKHYYVYSDKKKR
jgi:hypothetical protein